MSKSFCIQAARRRRSREGMTLVEIMIVVIIMALIATGVGVAVFPQFTKARVKSTQANIQTIRQAVMMYLADSPGKGCPGVQDLVEGNFLDKSKETKDAWDNDFAIQCDGDNIRVSSAGPDKEMGTDDDIH